MFTFTFSRHSYATLFLFHPLRRSNLLLNSLDALPFLPCQIYLPSIELTYLSYLVPFLWYSPRTPPRILLLLDSHNALLFSPAKPTCPLLFSPALLFYLSALSYTLSYSLSIPSGTLLLYSPASSPLFPCRVYLLSTLLIYPPIYLSFLCTPLDPFQIPLTPCPSFPSMSLSPLASNLPSCMLPILPSDLLFYILFYPLRFPASFSCFLTLYLFSTFPTMLSVFIYLCMLSSPSSSLFPSLPSFPYSCFFYVHLPTLWSVTTSLSIYLPISFPFLCPFFILL